MSVNSKNAILKALIDGAITELMIKSTGDVAKWNAKARVIVSESQPSDLTSNDLWISI